MPYPRMSGARSHAHRDCDEEIKESGPFMVAEALEAVRAAMSVSIGGLIALVMKQLRVRSGTKNTSKQSPPQET